MYESYQNTRGKSFYTRAGECPWLMPAFPPAGPISWSCLIQDEYVSLFSVSRVWAQYSCDYKRRQASTAGRLIVEKRSFYLTFTSSTYHIANNLALYSCWRWWKQCEDSRWCLTMDLNGLYLSFPSVTILTFILQFPRSATTTTTILLATKARDKCGPFKLFTS